MAASLGSDSRRYVDQGLKTTTSVEQQKCEEACAPYLIPFEELDEVRRAPRAHSRALGTHGPDMTEYCRTSSMIWSARVFSAAWARFVGHNATGSDFARPATHARHGQPLLMREAHIEYLRNRLNRLPRALTALDARWGRHAGTDTEATALTLWRPTSQIWLTYWSIHGLNVLGAPQPELCDGAVGAAAGPC